MLFRHLKSTLLIVALVSVAPTVFAEDAAPVYDADNMPSQFDGQADSGNNAPSSAITSPAPAPQLQPDRPFVSPQTLTLDQRLGRVEQQLNNADRSGAALRTEELQKEVQTLRGQVEELVHQVKTLQTQVTQVEAQQHTMGADIDRRFSKQAKVAKSTIPAPETDEPQNLDDAPKKTVKPPTQEASKVEKSDPTTAITQSKQSVTDQPDVAEEQQTYQIAYDLIKVKKYNDAIIALQKMLQKYPTGQFAANAHYWLGELYGLTGKNDKSADEFSVVMNDFPESPKVPDAQIKLGLIYVTEQKWSDAKSIFKRVLRKYPGTSSAHQALEQLKQIKQAGH